MKNNKILLALMPIFALMFTSCEEFLEEEVKDQISVDYVYSTPAGLEVGVNALYNQMRLYNFPSGDNNALWSNVFFMTGTDLCVQRTWNAPYGPNHTPVRFPGEKWIQGYRIVDRCSAIITAARNINMDPAAKSKLVAQARVIRGEVYLDLKQMYGNIVLDTIPTTPENINDVVEYKVASDADLYKLIDGDLDYAIKNLDFKVPVGRYGQGVARHIRGKSALWQKDWQTAANQFDAIINEGTHDLVPLNEVFAQNVNHKEALFVYQKDRILGGNDALAGGGGSFLANVFVQRLYEKTSGSVAGQLEVIPEVQFGGVTFGWFFPNNYLKSLYDQTNDQRFKAYYFSDNYLDYKVNNPKHPRFGQTITAPQENYRVFHWSLKKYLDIEKLPLANESYKDYMYYRLAETYLLASEAHHNLGNNTKALLYLNKVRRRGYTGSPTSTNAAFDINTWTLNAYLDESARELAFENNRWFLLKRLGLLVERQSLYYRTSTSGTLAGERPLPMMPFMVNMPIPQSQIDLMGKPAGFNVGY